MRTGDIIVLGVGGLVIFELLRKQSALGTLNFYPAGIKGLNFDGITPVLTFSLAAQNTSNKDFQLNSIAGNLYANDTYVGNVSAFDPFMIKANAQTVIDLNVRLALIGITNNIINAIQQNTFAVNLEFDSHANIDGLQVPINLKFKIGS